VLFGEPEYRLDQMRHGPVAEQTPPACPEAFTVEQRALWDATVECLTRMGLARKADQQRLADLVWCEWLVQDCIRRINETGPLIRGASAEPKVNPLLAVQRRADARATTLAREFGLTPSARSRLLPKPGDMVPT